MENELCPICGSKLNLDDSDKNCGIVKNRVEGFDISEFSVYCTKCGHFIMSEFLAKMFIDTNLNIRTWENYSELSKSELTVPKLDDISQFNLYKKALAWYLDGHLKNNNANPQEPPKISDKDLDDILKKYNMSFIENKLKD